MGVEGLPMMELAAKVRPWWESRLCLALVVVATMVPLLYPPIPPLVDRLVVAARAARADEAEELDLRAGLARGLLLPHLRLGLARADVLLGRRRPAARPWPDLVARRARGGVAYLGDGAAAPRHAHLAQRNAWGSDLVLVRVEGQVALDLHGAPRPVEMV